MTFHCTHTGCSARFASRSGYMMHMRRHSGHHLYQCPYCQKGVDSTSGIKYHIKSHHTGMLGYHCNRCRQPFENVRRLKAHLEQNSCMQG